MTIGGPVRRWKDRNGILWAENDLLRVASAVARFPEQEGTHGWHGPDEIYVEFISPKQAKAWDDCPCGEDGHK